MSVNHSTAKRFRSTYVMSTSAEFPWSRATAVKIVFCLLHNICLLNRIILDLPKTNTLYDVLQDGMASFIRRARILRFSVAELVEVCSEDFYISSGKSRQVQHGSSMLSQTYSYI